MDQSQTEIALEEDEGLKTKAVRSVCEICKKTLIHGASGTISMWIFDGIYCSCKPEQRTNQVLYFGPNSESGDAEAAALASLIASSTGTSGTVTENPADSLVAEEHNLPTKQQETSEVPPETKWRQGSLPPAGQMYITESGTLRIVPIPDTPEISIATNSIPLDAFSIAKSVSSEVTEVTSEVIRYDFRPTPIAEQFSPETRSHTVTREVLAAGLIALSEPESMVGKLVGDNYLIIELIGKGASGTVFKVNREGIPGVFALKILHPSRFSTRQNTRFLAQAKSVKELDHHNLLALYDAGVTDDLCPFIVTDFFGSERLSDTLDADGPFKERDAIDLFLQIAEGLIHIHYMGITHRDVKPSNVRVHENNDGTKTIKLADCGVGKMYPDPSRETRIFTESGTEYGDSRYMSPEQYSGVKADHRADIYSFGCLMYEVLTGRPPFVANKVSMLIYKHIKKRPRSISDIAPENQISSALEELIMRCLQKNPSARYQTVSDLKEDLETIRAGKPVRRVFSSALNIPTTMPRNLPELVIPDQVLSSYELVMSRISAAWIALWIGYSASARLSIKIVLFSAVVAFLLFTCFRGSFSHQDTDRNIEPVQSTTLHSSDSQAPVHDWNHKRSGDDPDYLIDWNAHSSERAIRTDIEHLEIRQE